MHPNQRSHRAPVNLQDMFREVDCSRLVLRIVAVTAKLDVVPRFDRGPAASHSQVGFPSQVGFLPPGVWHLTMAPTITPKISTYSVWVSMRMFRCFGFVLSASSSTHSESMRRRRLSVISCPISATRANREPRSQVECDRAQTRERDHGPERHQQAAMGRGACASRSRPLRPARTLSMTTFVSSASSANSCGVVSAQWDRAARSAAGDVPVRVAVVLDRLVPSGTPDLFTDDPAARRVQALLDDVRARYGAPALLWGECGDPYSPYTGAKIAYQSFPDMARLRWLGLVPGRRRGAGGLAGRQTKR